MNGFSDNAIQKYGLSDNDLFLEDNGSRLSSKGFRRLKKLYPYQTYQFKGALTSRHLLQLYQFDDVPYYISRDFKKIYIFGDEVNVIIRLLGDDIYKWLDRFVPSSYTPQDEHRKP